MRWRLPRGPAGLTAMVLVATSAVAAGCAGSATDETTASSTSGALVVVDPQMAAAADVTDGRISFPSSAAGSDLLARKPGDVLVSPRVAGSPGNSTGFLRKIASTTQVADRIVVTTNPAAVTDVVQDGSSHPSFTVPAAWSVVDIGQTAFASISESLASVDSSLSGNSLSITATVDNAHLGFDPDLDFSMAFADGELSAMHLGASGAMAASLAVDLDVKVDGTLATDALDYLQSWTIKLEQRLWSSEPYALPTQYIGVVPIEESVQMYVSAVCWVNFHGFTGGEMAVHAGVDTTSTVDGAIDYANGTWTPSDNASISGDGSLTLAKGATEKAVCQLAPSFALRFYDAVGPELGVGAGLSLSVAQPTADVGGVSDSTWSLSPDLRAWVQGDISVLGYTRTFGPYTLYEYETAPIAGSTSP